MCRSVSDEKMQKFFKNDFTEDRWRKAALKNAYALLGLQRFLHAAAFFLLAGSLRDAVDVSWQLVAPLSYCSYFMYMLHR